jgi:hypothetical protein
MAPQKFLGGNRDVFDDLAEKERRNIAAPVKWNRRPTAIGMPVLLVRTALTNLNKTEIRQYASHLAWSQNRKASHT